MSDDLRPQLLAHALTAWDTSEVDVRKALSMRLAVAFVGSASSGKDSAIKALFGIDFGEVSPIPGSTAEVRVAPLDRAGRVVVVNAPGFGDIRATVDRAARDVLDALDVIVYLVNCEGGATIDERRDLDAIRALDRPTLVVLNKIDLIRPAQRDEFVRATLAQLGVDTRDAVVAAFDPLPQLADDAIGVSAVIAWIEGKLEASGKELIFAKQVRNRVAACEPLLRAAARKAAMAGAIPVPGADLAVVTAIQVRLIRDIAAVFEVPVDRDVALFIITEVLSGGVRGFVRWGVEALKAAGWVPGGQIAEAAILGLSAAIAGATTWGIGRAAMEYFKNGRTLGGDGLRAVFDAATQEYRERFVASDKQP